MKTLTPEIFNKRLTEFRKENGKFPDQIFLGESEVEDLKSFVCDSVSYPNFYEFTKEFLKGSIFHEVPFLSLFEMKTTEQIEEESK